MKLRLSCRRDAAMTLFEVGIIVAAVIILAVVLLPSIGRHRISNAPRIRCVSNLKQVGLAYRIWEGDNGDVYPMGVSVTNGGSMEMVVTGDVVRTFQVMSNELSTPRILVCPADPARRPATGFDPLFNYNLSYMVGVDATNDSGPQMILSGDCNFELGGRAVGSGLQTIGKSEPLRWSASQHFHDGNIGLADGSVMQLSDVMLTNRLGMTGLVTNRLAIP